MEKNLIKYLLLVVLAILFCELNHVLPMVQDDQSYACCLEPQCWDAPHYANIDKSINGIGDIMRSQWFHYCYDNGRLPVHVIVQYFCGILGKGWFDLANSIMFILLILITAKVTGFASVDKNVGWRIYIPIFALSILLSEPKAWMHGIAHSVNYLWSTVAVLAAMLLVQGSMDKAQRFKIQGLLSVLLAILVPFLAGWSNECISAGAGAGMIYWIWRKRNNIDKKQILYLAAFCLGVVLLVFSPSNFLRLGDTDLGDWWKRPIKFIYCSWAAIAALIITIAGMFHASWLKGFSVYNQRCIPNGPETKDQKLIEPSVFAVAAIASLVFVLIGGVVTRRSLYGFELYSILWCLCVANEMILRRENAERIKNNIGKVCFILMTVGMAAMIPFQHAAGDQIRQIESIQSQEVPAAKLIAPRIFDKYICRFIPEDECRDSEEKANTCFQEWIWRWKWRLPSDQNVCIVTK